MRLKTPSEVGETTTASDRVFDGDNGLGIEEVAANFAGELEGAGGFAAEEESSTVENVGVEEGDVRPLDGARNKDGLNGD
jgi:hypothetical protein